LSAAFSKFRIRRPARKLSCVQNPEKYPWDANRLQTAPKSVFSGAAQAARPPQIWPHLPALLSLAVIGGIHIRNIPLTRRAIRVQSFGRKNKGIRCV